MLHITQLAPLYTNYLVCLTYDCTYDPVHCLTGFKNVTTEQCTSTAIMLIPNTYIILHYNLPTEILFSEVNRLCFPKTSTLF